VEADEHEWAKNYDRELEDVFSIQSDIAQNIAEALRIKLLEENRERLERPATQNTAAYNLYLKGRYFWNTRSKEALYKAIELYEKAIQIDPDLAIAHNQLGYLDSRNGDPAAAEEHFRNAVRAAPGFTDAWINLAATLGMESKFSEAEAAVATALKLEPANAEALQLKQDLAAGREQEK